jgi:mycoredoxin
VSDTEPTGVGNPRPDALDVYWRPGCSYCASLFKALDRAAVTVRRHNIWEDDEARAFVRAHNNGNETVPTVRLGDLVATNPRPSDLVALLETEYPSVLPGSRP